MKEVLIPITHRELYPSSGVEGSCIETCGVGRSSVTLDPTGIAWDCTVALVNHLPVLVFHRFYDNKVYCWVCRTTNLGGGDFFGMSTSMLKPRDKFIDKPEGYMHLHDWNWPIRGLHLNKPITDPQGISEYSLTPFQGCLDCKMVCTTRDLTKELSWTKAGTHCHLLEGVETGILQGSAPSG